MVRGEVWWAATPVGDRPVVVLTRDPVADRIGGVRGRCLHPNDSGSELPLGPEDGMPEPCVASFDNLHTLRRGAFRTRITMLSTARRRQLCEMRNAALGCPEHINRTI